MARVIRIRCLLGADITTTTTTTPPEEKDNKGAM
jgi:hypothetical protein